MTVITGRDNIHKAGCLGQRRFMILEIRSGIKMSSRRNLFNEVRQAGISTARRKKDVLRDLENYMINELGMNIEITVW